MRKILAVDLDGTCLNSKNRISKRTMAALKKASEQGYIVVPTTGRAYDCLPFMLTCEDFYRYVIVSNGARVMDLHAGRTAFSTLLPKEKAIKILTDARAKGLGLTVHCQNHYLKKIRYHDLRHSCATLLRHEGVPMEDIQKWLGHSQITITNKLYAHFEYEAHIRSADKIGKALEM